MRGMLQKHFPSSCKSLQQLRSVLRAQASRGLPGEQAPGILPVSLGAEGPARYLRKLFSPGGRELGREPGSSPSVSWLSFSSS